MSTTLNGYSLLCFSFGNDKKKCFAFFTSRDCRKSNNEKNVCRLWILNNKVGQLMVVFLFICQSITAVPIPPGQLPAFNSICWGGGSGKFPTVGTSKPFKLPAVRLKKKAKRAIPGIILLKSQDGEEYKYLSFIASEQT